MKLLDRLVKNKALLLAVCLIAFVVMPTVAVGATWVRNAGLLPGSAVVFPSDAPAIDRFMAGIFNGIYGDRCSIGQGTSQETQINAAIDTGCKVILHAGTFTIDGTITAAVANVNLEGMGRGTILFLANGSDAPIITVGGHGWTIRDLSFDGNYTNQTAFTGPGITLTNADDGLIENCYFTLCQPGIYGNSSENWRVASCHFEANGDSGIAWLTNCIGLTVDNCHVIGSLLNPGINIDLGARAVVITNSYFSGNGYCHVSVGENAACYDVAVSNCYFEAVADGGGVRYKQSERGSVVNCMFYQSLQESIHIWGSKYIDIVGNTFYNTQGGYPGIDLEQYATGPVTTQFITIDGNSFVDIGTTAGAKGIFLSTVADIVISNNIFKETRGAGDDDFHNGIDTGATNNHRITITGNVSKTKYKFIQVNDADCDDWVVANNIIQQITASNGISIEAAADDWIIQGNRIIGCSAPMAIGAASLRIMILGNNWEGCTNDLNINASATGIIYINNIDKNGVQWAVDNNPISKDVWVTSASQNPAMGTIPVASYIMTVYCHVTEAFNSDGTDILTVGYAADTDSIATAIDVSTTGVKVVVLGTDNGYIATARIVLAYYVNGGSEPNTGKAIIKVEFQRVPTQP